MKDPVRKITGLIISLLGVVLFYLAITEELVALIWGIPALIIGPMILFNRKEDEIEKIKIQENKKQETKNNQ